MGMKNGVPDLEVSDTLFPLEIAEKVWPTLHAMIVCMIFQGVDYILEGEAVDPDLLRELISQYPNDVSIVFIGYDNQSYHNKVNNIVTYSKGTGDWIDGKSLSYVRAHVSNMVKHSEEIKDKCLRCHIDYIDVSDDFHAEIDKAYHILMGDVDLEF